jgi:hypothetical protein
MKFTRLLTLSSFIFLAGCINADGNRSYWHGNSGESKFQNFTTKVDLQNTVISADNQIASFTLINSDKVKENMSWLQKRGYDQFKFEAMINEVLAEQNLLNPKASTGLTMQIELVNVRLPSSAESKLDNNGVLGSSAAIMETTITDQAGKIVAKYRYEQYNGCRICSDEQNSTILFRTMTSATAHAISTKGH